MKLYCPDCVEVLKIDHKKLGDKSVWYICPKCGYRTREMAEYYSEQKKLENLEAEKERVNNEWEGRLADKETDYITKQYNKHTDGQTGNNRRK